MKLIGIVGTNAQHSYNRWLLQYIQQHFAAQFALDICEIKAIPMFNENHPAADPDSVTQLAQTIEGADGVIFATPEHNHSIPSALKSVIEWLSYRSHPLANKPVMIIGASYHPQGSSRAQLQLRQILDSPGVNALVLPGNEFLMGNAKTAFDAHRQIKDPATIDFLQQCLTEFLKFIQTNTQADTTSQTAAPVAHNEPLETASPHWDAVYDVVVLGFGGAGATAARFAADEGARVLLTDAAPQGHEGGNTRYAHQLIGSGTDLAQLRAYHQQLAAPLHVDPAVLEAFLEGLVGMRSYLQKYLNIEPFSIKQQWTGSTGVKAIAQEYPEFAGSQSYDLLTVHEGVADAALWKILRQKVLDRKKQIDVWYNAPVRHLIQDPVTKTVIGVQIEREHVIRQIGAQNGVVLATGGFENNQQMIEDYLQEPYLAPVGTTYNQGIGIKLALEAGANLSHMRSYESLGQFHGLSPRLPQGQRSQHATNINWPALYTGSILVVGDDGTRYFKEDEINRHGHIFNHGFWRVPLAQQHPTLIFDQVQYEQIHQEQHNANGFPELLAAATSASTLAQLAQQVGLDPQRLQTTVEQFNHYAAAKVDPEFHRAAATLRPLSQQGPYYAVVLRQNLLNTQGGAQRNARCEVLAPNGQVIGHLYEAGELGAPFVNQYVAGGNLADCLISGKIAGQNAAQVKTNSQPGTRWMATKPAGAATTKDLGSDLDQATDFTTQAHQYLGRSTVGMGDELIVRITVDAKQNLQRVEVLQQNESADVSQEALRVLPQQMVTQNTYDVDVISGATATSKALKAAVQDALKQMKAEVK
ncbi:MAG: FAD-binding protein [Bombilactobacillus mellifer]|uniref:NAD(P)H-dependent oxidoreductase n=1 Tax=Bombilactobacillus mellifer TaxID=1218492 RepID=UPI0023F79B5E|nr:NAD(P)H-dependent oxidoreductase [Bombilactobacillus mellifer]MCT6894638.1 FAD-binding protein [Bombilactobacillus mellifer]